MKKVINGKTYDTSTAILIARAEGETLYYQKCSLDFFLVSTEGDLLLLDLDEMRKWLYYYYGHRAAYCATGICCQSIYEGNKSRYRRYMQELFALTTR